LVAALPMATALTTLSFDNVVVYSTVRFRLQQEN
jgi:hypothetical protein